MGNRRDLLKTMALLPLAACTSDLNKMGGEVEKFKKAPRYRQDGSLLEVN